MLTYCPHCNVTSAPLVQAVRGKSLPAFCSRCQRMWQVTDGHIAHIQVLSFKEDMAALKPLRFELDITFESHDQKTYTRKALVEPYREWLELSPGDQAFAMIPINDGKVEGEFKSLISSDRNYIISNIRQFYIHFRGLWNTFCLYVLLWVVYFFTDEMLPWMMAVAAIPPALVLWRIANRYSEPTSTPQAEAGPTPLQQIEAKQRELHIKAQEAKQRQAQWHARVHESGDLMDKMRALDDSYQGQADALLKQIISMRECEMLEMELHQNYDKQIRILEIERGKLLISNHDELLNDEGLIDRILAHETATEELQARLHHIQAESDLAERLGTL